MEIDCGSATSVHAEVDRLRYGDFAILPALRSPGTAMYTDSMS